jgi:hypothetical protein
MVEKLFPYPKKKIQHGSMEKPAAYQNGMGRKNPPT